MWKVSESGDDSIFAHRSTVLTICMEHTQSVE